MKRHNLQEKLHGIWNRRHLALLTLTAVFLTAAVTTSHASALYILTDADDTAIVLDSAANFVFARPQDGDAARVHAALRQAHVLVRYFPGARTGQWLRISIGTDAQMRALMEALDTI